MRRFRILAPIGFLLILSLGIFLWHSRRESALIVSEKAAVDSAASTPTPASQPENSNLMPVAPDLQNAFQDALAALRDAKDPAAAQRILDELRATLRSRPKAVALRALGDFLGSRADIATKLEFQIGKDGLLTSAPTLRVWLLDCLGQIDRNTAANFAKSILIDHASADEWAVCLRDFALARNSPDDVAFVQNKVREMLQQTAWKQQPSGGFLEAFDTIVYSHDTALTPDLAQLVTDKDNKAVAHAAYLTLDRLVLTDPKSVLNQLETTPELMAGREQTRANFFARADVRDPEQQALLETYLLDAQRTPLELSTFAGLYPNANYMISNNLLTGDGAPQPSDRSASDQAALANIDRWLADPRFTSLQPQLQKIHMRLAEFVREESALNQ